MCPLHKQKDLSKIQNMVQEIEYFMPRHLELNVNCIHYSCAKKGNGKGNAEGAKNSN